MANVGLVSLGCSKNQVDSEIMLGLIKEADFNLVDDYSRADLLIVNTCGFIADAKEESIETILELSKYKDERCQGLIVTGCLAQRYSEELEADIPEIDAILGTGNFDQIVSVIDKVLAGQQRYEVDDPQFDYYDQLPRQRLGDSYTAYVKIAEGCNNCCSYCIIPKLRGDLQSRELDEVVNEVQQLAKQGVKEINLVAQDVTKYGLDLYGQPQLVELLSKLVEIEGIKWIRLLYAYPMDMSDQLIEMIANQDKICNYIDLPIQHVDQRIRAKMGRPGNKEQILGLIKKLRNRIPDISIRTSLIVGFPGESEAQFNNLVDFVQQAEFDRLGVFKYSQEEGTPAAEMTPQISEEVKEERFDQIMSLQQGISLDRNQEWIGQEVEVLVEEIEEQDDGNLVIGRTQYDAPEIDGLVYINDYFDTTVGQFMTAKIVDAYEYDLIGEGV
ncbi:MAG: 30S ribosomal protein S12 methylthiotransferase RimO [Bacillota bacterium]